MDGDRVDKISIGKQDSMAILMDNKSTTVNE